MSDVSLDPLAAPYPGMSPVTLHIRFDDDQDGPTPLQRELADRIRAAFPELWQDLISGFQEEYGEDKPILNEPETAFEWAGNPAPRVHPAGQGMLNAVGLQGPGVASWLRDDLPPLAAAGVRVVASVWGRSVDDYRAAAEQLAAAGPAVVAVELNLSCPNLEGRRAIFAHDPDLSARIVDASAVCGRPRWADGDAVPYT